MSCQIYPISPHKLANGWFVLLLIVVIILIANLSKKNGMSKNLHNRDENIDLVNNTKNVGFFV